jgi:hypothetical protein
MPEGHGGDVAARRNARRDLLDNLPIFFFSVF